MTSVDDTDRPGRSAATRLVVGLEVHVELATATKLFSASPNRFGDEPNTNIDPVTLGLPGALPVLNRQAVELAMRLGLALNCTVQRSTFARKNYFYPDMPKAYQISQYDEPICIDGWLDLPDGCPRRHRAGPPGGGHRQVDPRRRDRRPHPRQRLLADRLQPRRRAARRDRQPARHPHARAGQGVRERTARDPRRRRCVRREDGGGLDARRRQRQRPAPGRRARHPLRDQERQLGALGRPGHRVRGAAPGRHARGRRVDPPGDAPLGRDRRTHPHACAARRTPTTTGTSRSPISSSSIPTPSGSSGCGRRCRCCPRHGASAWRPPPGSPSTPRPCSS